MPTPYRTLVIVPKTDLRLAGREADAIVNNLRAEQMSGFVTFDMVLTALQREKWDIVWFVTHTSEQGVLLSDGFASSSRLIQFLRGRTRLVVLNTCASLQIAFDLHNELRTYLVCTLSEVPDDIAYVTGRLFAESLGRGNPFRVAYNDALPGKNAIWFYFPGNEGEASDMPQRRSGGSTPIPTESLTELQETVRKLDIIVNGDDELRVLGLGKSLDSIKILLWILLGTMVLLLVLNGWIIIATGIAG